MAKSRPTVIISAAISVDGKIATRGGDSKISSRRDLARMHGLRSRVDAILVGTNTLKRDDPLLTVRRAGGKNPVRVVLDPRGEISPGSRILKTAGRVPTIIAVSKAVSGANMKRLEGLPVEVVVSGTARINTGRLLEKLAARGIKTLLVEGGGTVNWDFVKNGLFDRLVVTVSPRIIGGTDSVSLVRGRGFSTVRDSARLRLDRTERIGNEIVLYYSRGAGGRGRGP